MLHDAQVDGGDCVVEAKDAAPAQAGAASTPPSRVYARSKSAPGSSSAPSDDKAEKTQTRVSPGSASRSKSTALQQEKSTSSAPTRPTRDASSSGADTQPEVSGSVEFPDEDREGPDAFQWLLTRQLEVEMSLRGAPPATQADVEATRVSRADDGDKAWTTGEQVPETSAAETATKRKQSEMNGSPPR